MAKEPKTRKSPPLAGARETFDVGYELKQVDLFALNVSQSLPVGNQEAEGSAFFEGKAFTPPLNSEYPAVIVSVTFTAKREPSKEFGSTVIATYVCIVQVRSPFNSENHKKVIAEHVARNHAWQKFRDLLGFIVVQGNINLPKPPITLDAIKFESS